MSVRGQQPDRFADERRSVGTRLTYVDLTMERRQEKQLLYSWLDTFSHTPGQLMIIEGTSGSGKAQFIKKAAKRSQNRNLLLVSCDGRRLSGPYGVFSSWIDSIRMSDLPASVAQELSAFVSTRRLLSLLSGQTNDTPTRPGWRLPTASRGAEQKAQLTAEIVRFLTVAARHRPILLVVANYDKLDLESRSLVERVLIGLRQSPIGLMLTVPESDSSTAPLTGIFDVTTIKINPLNSLQVQALIRQVCKRHQLNDSFVEQLTERTAGNPSKILLTLWYLIETRYLVYKNSGWTTASSIPWETLPDDLHTQIATRLVEVSQEGAALLKGLSIAQHHLTLTTVLDLLGWNREQYRKVSEELNQIFPMFNTTSFAIEAVVSSGILAAVKETCVTKTEAEAWGHRIAGHLADSGRPNIHEEIAEIYDGGGCSDIALTYRIAATHAAKSIACYNRATHNLMRALETCGKNTALHARLLIRLGDIHHLSGRGEEARECAETAIRIAREIGSLKLEADAKFSLAGFETSEDDLVEGLVRLDQSLALYRAAGRTDGLLSVLGKMAAMYRELRMWPQSDAINDEMLSLAELEGNSSRLATAHINAAISTAVRGERARAAEHLYGALRICRKCGYWDLITLALIDFADALGEGSEASDTDRYYVAAVASARRRFDEIRELEALYKLAGSYLVSRSYRKARTTADQVIALAETRGESRYRGEATRIAGVCAWKSGNREEASSLFESALRIADEAGDEVGRARTLADQGDWAAERHPDRAEVSWREARNIFCRHGVNTEVLRMDKNLIRHTYEHARTPERYSHAV